MSEEDAPENLSGDLLLYRTPKGEVRLDVRVHDESLWMPQKAMAELFASISRHLKNIFETGELDETSVVTVFVTTASDGKRGPPYCWNYGSPIAKKVAEKVRHFTELNALCDATQHIYLDLAASSGWPSTM